VAKRKILGCSFPVVIGVGILLLLLVIYSLAGGPIGSAILNINYPDWLKVSRPAPELPAEVIFNTGGFAFTNSMIATWITIVVVVLLSYFAFRKPRLIPRGLQSLMEFIFGSLLSFCQSIAGEKNGRRFFPVVATIFIFVLANAWLSLLPFYGNALYVGHNIPLIRGANTDINVPLGVALFSFISVWYFGIRMQGFIKYSSEFVRVHRLKTGLGKLLKGNIMGAFGDLIFGVIDLFSGGIELLSQFIRIISFTFRLFGNMIAGEILLLVITYLVGFGVPVVFYVLELLVGFVQALIFGGLTLIFLTLAGATHEEEPT
jgi:F-type H+-transporting ATPase subunit a